MCPCFRLIHRLIKPFLFGIIIILSFSQCKIYTAYHEIVSLHKQNMVTEKKGVPRLEYVNSIPILHLYGTPAEMGQQYGTLLKKELNSLMKLTDGLYSQKKIDKYIEDGKIAGKNLPVKMQIELKGITDASGIEYSKLLALNMATKATCSTLSLWGKATADGKLIMGRNADYKLKNINKALGLIVVKHPNEGYATISVTFLGLLGSFTGMNETGLSYGNMLSYNGFDRTTNLNGLPIQILMQLGGEKFATAEEMTKFLTSQSHMINNNVMCADSNEAIVVELSPSQCSTRRGKDGVLAATNFFHNPDMCDHFPLCDRYSSMMLYVQRKYGQITINELKNAMHLARRKRGHNIQCILFEPANKKLYISINKVPASKGPFTEFDAKKLLEN